MTEHPVFRPPLALAGPVLVLALGFAPLAAHACATCGCTLSGDAAAGYSAVPGWRLNLQFDYIDQNQLRSGTHEASPRQLVDAPADPAAGGGEIERDTINRYLTLGLAYAPSSDWSVTLQVPWVSRNHTTFGVQDAPFSDAEIAPDQLSGVRFAELGDIKVTGAWQGWLPDHNLGLQVGIKLPTGRSGTAIDFATGPNAGTPLDASLQPGTGSTDLIAGAYYYHPIGRDFEGFVNGQFQGAVIERDRQPGADFRPGNTTTVSFGIRYEADPKWAPQLQINLSHKSADQGALADTFDTAGTVAYLSPGVTVHVAGGLRVYGFVQVPIASNLQGYQLFPRWTATAAASYSF
jgi:hypothetical protein